MPSEQVREVLSAAVEAVAGRERPGQVEMAEAVDHAFSSGKHLLVQAGTGTGKSLGYLVPSLLRGDRVVIATATLNLQHQLLERDIPILKRAVSSLMDEVPAHAVVKGRGNYACMHRVHEGAPDDQGVLIDVPEGSLGAEVLRLRQWATDAAEDHAPGDRDSAPSHTERSWRQVSVSARECLGANRCAYADQCFAERARDEAQHAQLIVTNHAMLAIDTIEGVPMLPGFEYVVIDEAHELTSRVTQAVTVELDPGGVERTARRAASHVRDPDVADQLTEAADQLAQWLDHTPVGRIDAMESGLRSAVVQVGDGARACLSGLVPEPNQGQPDAARQHVKSMLEAIRDVAESMAAESETDVLWKAESTSGLRLVMAPVDVSGALREGLFEPKTVAMTSATLAIGGSFDPVARACGLVEEEMWTGIDVGSPFDYSQQGILYVARHLPPPGRDGLTTDHLGEITALIAAAGGRTLGLFSSRRAAEQAAAYVRESLPQLDILCQGDAQLSELAARFTEHRTSCLFGTLSLWQGLDVPGDTCNLVIIDRIPFPRPDDPLMSAKQRRVEQQGRNGFMEVAAQHAALLMAQGAGRLIRSHRDRGVVAVLDPRLATARYGAYIAASIPPLWRTTDRMVVTGALARLNTAEEAAAVTETR